MVNVRLGDIAPNFQSETSQGKIDFHQFIDGKWTILFSHPDDYLIGLSANNAESHKGWIKDIDALSPNGPGLEFPIIADEDRKVSELYGMLDHLDATNVDKKGIPFTVRTVFIIDPEKKIRLTLAYPASTGRSFPEILRVIDSLQLGDKHKITTPANWKKGDDVIIHPSVQGEKVKELFGDDVKTVYPYLRFTSDPSKKQTA
ncbi:uncharacterized protein I303_100713 [Kwoniella dejecticola CBS 10117]|uniref:Thioredoxin domain-containing protein n=1 Tax=Kwoniella dejecticola CBS 10117 TaxID=1296121 RepID=A0AAJ8MEK4_9TREE